MSRSRFDSFIQFDPARVRAALGAAGLTQAAIARVLGCTRGAICTWLKTGRASHKAIASIAKACGVSVEFFIPTDEGGGVS